MRPPGGRACRLASLGLWLVLLAAAIAVLLAAGDGPLRAPALTSPSAWARWASGRSAVVVAFAGLRLLALAAAAYAAVITVAGALLRLLSAGTAAGALDRLTAPPLRRLLAATVSVGITTGGMAAPVAGATLGRAVAVGAPSTTTVASVPPTITMHRLPPAAAPPAAPAPPADAPPDATGSSGPTVPAAWTVRPGQCFWSIADHVLTDAWGRRPRAREIVPYWRRLIDANRPVLAHRDNPDLIFAGQVFAVPEPPSVPPFADG